jgi:hypothetical protein
MPFVRATVRAAVQTLAVDAVTARVVSTLRNRAIPCVVLRGPAIAAQLYDGDELRAYVDVDLLVPPASWREAGETLAALGFRPAFTESDMPRHRRLHASEWTNDEARVSVDLHRTLSGVQAEDGEVWDAFSESGQAGSVAGEQVVLAGPVALALVVALHAAQHGVREQKSMEDLRRALERLDGKIWEETAALAVRLGAVSALSAGLRLLPRGAELADRLGLPAALPVEVALRASAAPKLALGLEWLSRTHGLRAKIALVLLALVPPPGALRAWRPLARRGRIGLVAAYLSHPLWLARHVVPSLRAYRRAKKGER